MEITMRLDVKMEIYGTVSSPEILNDIVNVALEVCKEGEWKDFLAESNEDDAVALARYISTTGAEGLPFVMEVEDTRYEFEDLRSAARAAGGIGYRVLSSGEDSLGYNYVYAFRPDWSAEREADIAGEDSPMIDHAQLRAAMAEGMRAVEEVVRKAEAVALLPGRCEIVVPDRVYAAWKAAYDEENGYEPSV